MSKIVKQVEVSKSASEVGECLVQLVKSTQAALADGFQPGQDIPAVIGANITNLLTVIKDIGDLPAEEKEDASAFIKAFALSSSDLAGLFISKPSAAPAGEAPKA